MDLLFFPVAYLVLSSSPLLHYGLLQGRISILHALLEIARFHSCIWSSGACWEETFHAKCVFLVICRLFGIMLRDPVAGLKSTLIGNEFEKGLMMQALRGHVAPRTGRAMALGLSLHSHLSRRGFIWVWQQKKTHGTFVMTSMGALQNGPLAIWVFKWNLRSSMFLMFVLRKVSFCQDSKIQRSPSS